MKMLRTLIAFAVLFVLAVPAAAQWQTQNHSVPIGSGGGIQGFRFAAPGTAGLPLTSTGPSGTDPTFNNQLGTGAYAPGSVTYPTIQNVSAGKILCNPPGSAAPPSECSLGTGMAFVGSAITNTVPASFSGVAGLVIANDASTPNTQIDVTAAQLAINNAGSLVYATNISVAISMATTGANALDTGTRAANTWYNVFLIYNGTTVSGLASLSASAPVMPSGYTFFVRVGAVRTDGSTNLLRTKQTGQRAQYTLVTGSNTATYPTIYSTGASNITAWTAESVSNLVPPTATRIVGALTAQGATSLVVGLSMNGVGTLVPGNAVVYFLNNNAAAAVLIPFDLILESTNVFAGSSGSITSQAAYTYGWTDAVNAN